jgi:heme exporter protein A
VLEKSETFHEELLYLGHSNGLKDDLTALEALQFLVKIHGDDGNLVILENALRQLGIFHRRHLPVRTLSQGQRKRVALARLVAATRPRVWVLDEPFDAIDDGGIGIVSRLLETHIAQGGCVVLTSHIPLVMKDFKIETLQMETGRIA